MTFPNTDEIDTRIGELRAQVLANGSRFLDEFNEAPNDMEHVAACWRRLDERNLPHTEEIFRLRQRKQDIARAVRALMERR